MISLKIQALKTIYKDQERVDYDQFLEIAQAVDECAFLISFNVPNIVKDIAEFAVGKIVHCGMCKEEHHLLLSDAVALSREYLCKSCFQEACRQHDKLLWNVNMQFGHSSDVVGLNSVSNPNGSTTHDSGGSILDQCLQM